MIFVTVADFSLEENITITLLYVVKLDLGKMHILSMWVGLVILKYLDSLVSAFTLHTSMDRGLNGLELSSLLSVII